jgi:hypothetical protein
MHALWSGAYTTSTRFSTVTSRRGTTVDVALVSLEAIARPLACDGMHAHIGDLVERASTLLLQDPRHHPPRPYHR